MPNYVRGEGASRAKLVIVGEAPGKYEDEAQRPFQGPSGLLLNKMLAEAGVDRSEVYVTNIFKYRPPFNDIRRIREVLPEEPEKHVEQLWAELWEIKPNCVLALGNTALYHLTGKSGISNWRGSILNSKRDGWKVVPTLHPAALLHMEGEEEGGVRSQAAKVYMQFDIRRSVEQSAFPQVRTPQRLLEIARHSADVWRFWEQYKHKRHVSVDIEVIHCIPICVALAFNSQHAMSIPLLDVMSWQNKEGIPSSELALMWKMVSDILSMSGMKIIGQNFKFDLVKLLKACGMRVNEFWLDTGLLMHTLYPELPKSLGFMTSIFTEEPYYKDEGKEFNIKKDDIKKFFTYNARDAAVTYEVAFALAQEAKELEVPGFENYFQNYFLDYMMQLPELYIDIEDEGLLLDKPRQKELIKEYTAKIKVKEKRLYELVGWEINIRSNPQLSALLYKDLKFPKRAGANVDTLVALQANHTKPGDPRREIIDLILDLRGMYKSLGTYFKARADYDGYMRTSYNIAGTETGRSSTKILKAPLRPHKMGLAFQTMTKHGDIGAELRSMFVAEPGYVLLEVDLSQAEARIVALLGKSQETLDLFNSGADIHKLTSTWVFAMPETHITKELRFVGKTTRHAGNYDMQKKRLMNLVNTKAKKFNIDISISEYRAGLILERFHKFSPWIKEVFHEEVVDALANNNRILINPYGRRRQFMGDWDSTLWREAYAQIPQSTVADHMKRAMLRVKKRLGKHFRCAVEAHDAFVVKVPERHVDEFATIFAQELEVPIDFSNCSLPRGQLIIPCDAQVGYNYKDLKPLEIKRAA